MMIRLETLLSKAIINAANFLWKADLDAKAIQVQKTRREFEGDITLVVFPLVRLAKKSPEETAKVLGNYLSKEVEEISSFNVVKGFLNLKISDAYWLAYLSDLLEKGQDLSLEKNEEAIVMVEYASPNTNKPLHLGHIRNILLGHSISKILQATGSEVQQVNLVNDRGIHICKSMVAWKRYGNGATPESSGKKGDKLVGDFYVAFDKEYKKQVAELVSQGRSKKQAEDEAEIMVEARDMLRKWEAGDAEVRKLWSMMNGWVYDGFDATYATMGVKFDKIYYESETYKQGRKIVLEGLEKGILEKEADGSVWADLTDRKLDRKLLLRSDGTSVYMTQDVGTADQRFDEFPIKEHIYVVGNEQNYHFQVLRIVLDKLGYEWANKLYHLSYGMVELPEGKMKSREGTVVDADDLMQEMINIAEQMSKELGKLDEYPEEAKQKIYRQIGMGALKYFILKVDPKKNMLFDPKESIDFNGNTGPFIQYTYARIKSVLRSAGKIESTFIEVEMNDKEIALARMVYDYPDVVKAAALEHNPSLIANFLYDLAKEFNQFYHDYSILNAENKNAKHNRILLSKIVAEIIDKGMELLGIEVPERM